MTTHNTNRVYYAINGYIQAHIIPVECLNIYQHILILDALHLAPYLVPLVEVGPSSTSVTDRLQRRGKSAVWVSCPINRAQGYVAI